MSDRSELVALVQRILDARYTEAELPGLLDLLTRSTACPEVSNFIFWPEREMTATEIVDAALAHRPIALGPELDNLEATTEEKNLLDARLAAHDQNPDSALTLDQMVEKLKKLRP